MKIFCDQICGLINEFFVVSVFNTVSNDLAMIRAALLSLAVINVVECSPAGRIVGGTATAITNYPYTVRT